MARVLSVLEPNWPEGALGQPSKEPASSREAIATSLLLVPSAARVLGLGMALAEVLGGFVPGQAVWVWVPQCQLESFLHGQPRVAPGWFRLVSLAETSVQAGESKLQPRCEHR